MDKLSSERIEAWLEDQSDWSLAGDAIQRTLVFDDFVAAIEFVNRVAELAESQQHHPDIMVRWNKVTLTVSTHDAGGLTEKDFELAGAVSEHAPAVG
ncbi:MAG: 4a-hydroxytetrahydrobiopterin dehydratase [Phycisphaerales bacterium]